MLSQAIHWVEALAEDRACTQSGGLSIEHNLTGTGPARLIHQVDGGPRLAPELPDEVTAAEPSPILHRTLAGTTRRRPHPRGVKDAGTHQGTVDIRALTCVGREAIRGEGNVPCDGLGLSTCHRPNASPGDSSAFWVPAWAVDSSAMRALSSCLALRCC